MKKQKSYIQLSIPEPCDEKWSEMTPVQGGNFCHQCTRRVVDFTNMTDIEIGRYYQQNQGQLCGQFRITQLNHPIPLPPEASKVGQWKAVAAVSAALLFGGNIAAQTQYNPSSQIIENNISVSEKPTKTTGLKILKGTVTDLNQEALIGASILLKGTHFGTVSDVDGNFQLEIADEVVEITIVVSYTGFETIEVINPNLHSNIAIILKAGVTLDEVVVIGGLGIIKGELMGYGVTEKKSKTKPFRKPKIVNTPETPSSHIYPNPFEQTFALKFNAPKNSVYLVNVYDISGKLVYAETFELKKGKQNFQLTRLPSNLIAGTYVLQVSRANKVLFTEQLVKIGSQ